MNIEIIAIFAFGVIYTTAILVIAVFLKDMSPQQYAIFRTVLALAGAGVGALIPGIFQLNSGAFKAGGAMSVFVAVYFFSPALVEQTRQVIIKPIQDIQDSIAAWFKLIDNFDYENAYYKLAKESRDLYSKNHFVEIFDSQRTPLGEVIKRTKIGVQNMQGLPDGRRGTYSLVTFLTEFKGKAESYFETILLVANQSEWDVCEHGLMVKK